MIRTGFRAVYRTLGTRTFASIPAEQKPPISTSFKIQDSKDFVDRVEHSKIPVVVDFFATWCNPCRLLTPRIEQVVAEKQGKILLAKVDIDENSELALAHDVGSVPVLLIMRDGKVLDRMVGLQDVDKLKKFVEKHLSS